MTVPNVSYNELFHAAAQEASSEYDKSFEELQAEDLKEAQGIKKAQQDEVRKAAMPKKDLLARSDKLASEDQAALDNLPDDLAMAYADQAVAKAEPEVESPP